MRSSTLRSDSLLLLTSLIWGLAFVAQREGMESVGPFIFNGIRFALGSLVILPLIYFSRKKERREGRVNVNNTLLIRGGSLLGIVLFGGATLQQYGLVYTTAGNAGFITGLYVVFVPILGLFRKQFPHFTIWIAVLFAALGMYFLSVTEGFNIFFGDLLVLFGAFFWAAHVVIIGVLSPRVNTYKLALIQNMFCAVLSLILAFTIEENTWAGVMEAAIPILYGGLLSVGIAYTLQIVAQKKAPPAHAAIILSLEAVFAVIGGWLYLHEQLGPRQLIGCGLMLLGILVAQYCSIAKNCRVKD